ncbi:MAG: hypothetical protein ACR2RB_08505 [Gammaproteobacteria bacterium]
MDFQYPFVKPTLIRTKRWRGAYAVHQSYARGDLVDVGGVEYIGCIEQFVAGDGGRTFGEELALGYWELAPNYSIVDSVFRRTGHVIAEDGDYTLSQITNVPFGNLVATNGQDAVNELQADVDLRLLAAEKGADDGVATLDGNGQVPISQLPALAITDIYPVADITARNLLMPQKGDVAIIADAGGGLMRTDIFDGTNWLPLFLPTPSSIGTVFGRVGNVVATAGDYHSGQVTHVPTAPLPAGATNVKLALDQLGALYSTLNTAVSNINVLDRFYNLLDTPPAGAANANRFFRANATGTTVEAVALGSAAYRDIGNTNGNVPVVGAGNKLALSIIPTGTGAGDLFVLDGTGKIPAALLPPLSGSIDGGVRNVSVGAAVSGDFVGVDTRTLAAGTYVVILEITFAGSTSNANELRLRRNGTQIYRFRSAQNLTPVTDHHVFETQLPATFDFVGFGRGIPYNQTATFIKVG